MTAIVDGSGTVIERYAYDPFGVQTVLDDDWSEDADGGDGVSDVEFLNGFQGLRVDPVTWNLYMRNRDYSPSFGRFTSLDRILFEAGDMNMYRFAWNGPNNFTDPSGLQPPGGTPWRQPNTNPDPTYYMNNLWGRGGQSSNSGSAFNQNVGQLGTMTYQTHQWMAADLNNRFSQAAPDYVTGQVGGYWGTGGTATVTIDRGFNVYLGYNAGIGTPQATAGVAVGQFDNRALRSDLGNAIPGESTINSASGLTFTGTRGQTFTGGAGFTEFGVATPGLGISRSNEYLYPIGNPFFSSPPVYNPSNY